MPHKVIRVFQCVSSPKHMIISSTVVVSTYILHTVIAIFIHILEIGERSH